MLKTRHALDAAAAAQRMRAAIDQALDELSAEWGIDL